MVKITEKIKITQPEKKNNDGSASCLQALRRGRGVRDRTNLLDISDSELIERLRFGRQELYELIQEW